MNNQKQNGLKLNVSMVSATTVLLTTIITAAVFVVMHIAEVRGHATHNRELIDTIQAQQIRDTAIFRNQISELEKRNAMLSTQVDVILSNSRRK